MSFCIIPLVTRCVVLVLAVMWFLPFSSSAAATTVSLQRNQGGWTLLRNGQPFFIKGAVGWTYLDRLAASGANAVRLGANEKSLDEAHQHGLGVLVGLPLGKPRMGFDYNDAAKVTAQREKIRELVERLKDHPAVLMWAVGNEPTIFTEKEQRQALWKEVNHITGMIRSIDTNHPIIAVVGGEQWRNNLAEIAQFCPALDAIGLNAYADMMSLPQDLERQGWTRPYLITEFGPRGHWQVGKTAWNARLEDTSTEKAAFYRNAYEHAIKGRPQCLGAFAFLWSWKMEKTHTWYGMFLKDGSPTEAVDVMTFLWSGRWPANRCPSIQSMNAQADSESSTGSADPGVFAASGKVRCVVQASDPENDPLAIEWDLRRDVADDPRVGGDYEALEPPIPGAVLSVGKNEALIQLPETPGKYRIFVYVRDANNRAATANLPIISR